MLAFKPFLQYFATGSDTTSYQDYEEYEFVKCLSEETQVIDLFKRQCLCIRGRKIVCPQTLPSKSS